MTVDNKIVLNFIEDNLKDCYSILKYNFHNKKDQHSKIVFPDFSSLI